MQKPNLLCLCPTYRRPELLQNALGCFLLQDYPLANRRLLICDDAMQVFPQKKDREGWQVVNRTDRAPSMPDKLDEMVNLGNTIFNKQFARDIYKSGKKVATDIIFEEWKPDAYVLWHDDDVYLPRHLDYMAACLSQRTWVHPSQVYISKAYVNSKDASLRDIGFGEVYIRWSGSFAISMELLKELGGWVAVQKGQEQNAGYGRNMLEACLRDSMPADVYKLFGHSYIKRKQSSHSTLATSTDESWYREYPTRYSWPAELVPFLEPKLDEETNLLLSRFRSKHLAM